MIVMGGTFGLKSSAMMVSSSSDCVYEAHARILLNKCLGERRDMCLCEEVREFVLAHAAACYSTKGHVCVCHDKGYFRKKNEIVLCNFMHAFDQVVDAICVELRCTNKQEISRELGRALNRILSPILVPYALKHEHEPLGY